ncbi:MAG: cytochrome c-type biogenesis protein [Dongiaceae bacterium]
MRAAALALLLLVAGTAAWAVLPDEMLDDPALEARARDISKNLRCLVCQNQSIDDSDAELARDLRLLVRERLTAGDSDDQATQFIVARYGDFVLLKPPFKPGTYALWFGPAVVLVLAGIGARLYFRRMARAPRTEAAPLSDDERRRLRAFAEREGEG